MAENIVLERSQVASPPGKEQTVPLEKALEQVRLDSRRDAQVYLDETVVPHGGE